MLDRFRCLRLRQPNIERAKDLTDKQIFFYISIHKLLDTYIYYCIKANFKLEDIENKVVFIPSNGHRSPERLR